MVDKETNLSQAKRNYSQELIASLKLESRARRHGQFLKLSEMLEWLLFNILLCDEKGMNRKVC